MAVAHIGVTTIFLYCRIIDQQWVPAILGIRRGMARVGARTGTLGVAHRWRLRHERSLRVLAYHRIVDPASAFDANNVSATPEAFDRQMALVKQHYNVITLAELNEALRGAALPPRPLLITFDDGYADNCLNALPILQRHGLTAVFHVVTSTIGQRSLFWFDRAACLVQRQPAGTPLSLPGFTDPVDTSTEHRTAALLGFLKRQTNAERCRHMARIDDALASSMPDADTLAPHLPMDWDQIRMLLAAGMAIGSHSHSHPILSKLPDRCSIARELCESKIRIERHTGERCTAVSYPEGLAYALDERVYCAARQAGFSAGFTSIRGVNGWPLAQPLALRRIQIHHSMDASVAEAAIAFPEWVD